jgi:hypothetical protein
MQNVSLRKTGQGYVVIIKIIIIIIILHSSFASIITIIFNNIMPLIRKLDHVIQGAGVHFGTRSLVGGRITFRNATLNGGAIHNLRYGKWMNHRRGRGVMGGRGVMSYGLPMVDTIPTPYNTNIPGRMKRSREMSKESVIARMAKLQRS